MPQLGHFKKSPVYLSDKLNKAKNNARHLNGNATENGGFLTQKAHQNGRNIAFDAVKKSVKRLSQKAMEVAEKAGEKAIEKLADKALEKVVGKN